MAERSEGSAISVDRNVREANPRYERLPYLPRVARAADAKRDDFVDAIYWFLPSWVPRVRRDASPESATDPNNERPPYLPRPTVRTPFRVVREADPGLDWSYMLGWRQARDADPESETSVARAVREADPGLDIRPYSHRFRRQPPPTYTDYLCDYRPASLPFSCWT
ncbi:hypothetical protein ACLKA7_012624 [Drosophila subpalustris]